MKVTCIMDAVTDRCNAGVNANDNPPPSTAEHDPEQ